MHAMCDYLLCALTCFELEMYFIRDITATYILFYVEIRSLFGFCWWLLAHLSTVCGGHYWQYVHEHLLPSSFLASATESDLRTVLYCASVLTHRWTPSLQVFTKSWEFFYRNMVG